MADKAAEIGLRFYDEQAYIERYVRMQRAKSTVHDRQVQDLNRILKRVHAPLLPVRHYDRIGDPYAPEGMAMLLAGIRRTEPEVYQTLLGHEQALDGSGKGITEGHGPRRTKIDGTLVRSARQKMKTPTEPPAGEVCRE